MLLLRAIDRYPESDEDAPKLLAASLDDRIELDEALFPHRVWKAQDALALLIELDPARYRFLGVRGMWPQGTAEWDRFRTASENDEIDFELSEADVNLRFQVTAPFESRHKLSSLQLPEWGEYTFGAYASHPGRRPNEAVELRPLAWNGAFEVHGVFTEHLDEIIGAANVSAGVQMLRGKVDIQRAEIEGEGRDSRDLFFGRTD